MLNAPVQARLSTCINGDTYTMRTNNNEETSLHDDLLLGAPKIAEFLGWNTRKVYHAHRMKHLPIGHCGGSLIARKSELNRALSVAAS